MTWIANENVGAWVWDMGPVTPLAEFILPVVRTDLLPADVEEVDFVLVPNGTDVSSNIYDDDWYVTYRYRSGSGWSNSGADTVYDDGLTLMVVFFNLDYEWPASYPSVTAPYLVPSDLAAGGAAPPPPPGPANDDFANATVLGPKGHLKFDSTNATQGYWDFNETIWYSWTAPADMWFAAAVDKETVNDYGNFNVFEDIDNSGVEGNWNTAATSYFSPIDSIEAVVKVQAGKRYFLRINGYGLTGTLWWGEPDMSEPVYRDPISYDDTNPVRSGYTINTGAGAWAFIGTPVPGTIPRPFDPDYCNPTNIGGSYGGGSLWETNWNGPSEYVMFDVSKATRGSSQSYNWWRAAPEKFYTPAPGGPPSEDYLSVVHDTEDGTPYVGLNSPVRIRGSFYVRTGWEGTFGALGDDWVYVWRGGALFELPADTPNSSPTVPPPDLVNATPLVTYASLGVIDPDSNPELKGQMFRTLFEYDVTVDPQTPLTVMDYDGRDATLLSDPDDRDWYWHHIQLGAPPGYPDPPYRPAGVHWRIYRGQIAHSHVAASDLPIATYRVTGTYTPAPYRWVKSIIGKIAPPMRQRHRDDGLTTDARQQKGHGSSQQSSIRQGGRVYY